WKEELSNGLISNMLAVVKNDSVPFLPPVYYNKKIDTVYTDAQSSEPIDKFNYIITGEPHLNQKILEEMGVNMFPSNQM
ncbi:MAG: hypothetical protein MZV64_32240, partial [Ignavibacteriales bacterium]|nr:hypothetical protein [Ignavibacteriales bacterium]